MDTLPGPAAAAFSMEFFSLAGRRAIVTGGTTGLGRAFTVALATAGADVFVAGLDDDGGVTRDLVEATGRRMAFRHQDLTEPDAARRVVDGCLDALGGLDILVNSAGICHVAPIAEFGRERWDPMLAVNLTAPFALAHQAAAVMAGQRSGKIVNVCSLFSYLGGQRSPAYAATKHGLAGLTKAYADELGAHNVQVNGIAPGYYATELTAAHRADPQVNRQVLDHIPAGRWGEPVDLMGALVFLCSRASDYVTGHLLVVDGGYLVR